MNNIYTTFFQHGTDHKYKNMVYKLKQSVSKHMPDWNLYIKQIIPPKKDSKVKNNLFKLKEWSQVYDVNPYILIDGDTYIRADISDVFKDDFDIAFTKRTSGNPLINVGVVFVKPSKKTKRFFNEWLETAYFLLDNPNIYRIFKAKYKAICQPALGYMLENNKLDYLNIEWLPCSIYNACEDDWGKELSDIARVVHLKSIGVQNEMFRTDTLDYFHINLDYGQYKTIPSQTELNKFIERAGYIPNLDNPKTYNEKITWKKHNDRNPLIIQTSDKVAVRDFVKERGLEDILVPLIDISDVPYTIHTIPRQGVLKPNNASQRYIFLNNVTHFEPACKQANGWLEKSYGTVHGEWAYSQIKPKLITEELISSKPCDGIKLLCFHGKPKYIYAQEYKMNKKVIVSSIALYDLDWNKQDVCMLNLDNTDFSKPKKLDQAIQIAEILSKPFDFVRVDLHFYNEEFYFSELTHYPTCGCISFNPSYWDYRLGELWTLPI